MTMQETEKNVIRGNSFEQEIKMKKKRIIKVMINSNLASKKIILLLLP